MLSHPGEGVPSSSNVPVAWTQKSLRIARPLSNVESWTEKGPLMTSLGVEPPMTGLGVESDEDGGAAAIEDSGALA